MIIVYVTAVSKLAGGRPPVAQRSNKVKDVTEMHTPCLGVKWCFYLVGCHVTAGEHGAQL